jgi:hypothetical protein
MEFIRSALGVSWCEQNWRPVREEQLFLAEQTHLPALQGLAACYREIVQRIRADPTGDARCRSAIAAREEQRRVTTAIWLPGNRLDPAQVAALDRCSRVVQEAHLEVKDTISIYHLAAQMLEARQREARGGLDAPRLRGLRGLGYVQGLGNAQVQEDDAEFGPVPEVILKCPHGECRGYLKVASQDNAAGVSGVSGASELVTCELCGSFVCLRCMQCTAAAAPHVCNKDDVASMRAIRRECKPCPWPGCCVSTYRISGCSQMWCTSCQRPWDWNTGRALRDTRYFHNPHFIEYERARQQRTVAAQAEVRARGGVHGVMDDNLDDGDEGCVCVTNLELLRYMITRDVPDADVEVMRRMNELLERVERTGYHTWAMESLEARIVRMRVMYQAGEISAAELRRCVYLSERMRHAVTDVTQILQTTAWTVQDITRDWMARHRRTVAAAHRLQLTTELTAKFVALRNETNLHLQKSYRVHGTHPVQLAPTWRDVCAVQMGR